MFPLPPFALPPRRSSRPRARGAPRLTRADRAPPQASLGASARSAGTRGSPARPKRSREAAGAQEEPRASNGSGDDGYPGSAEGTQQFGFHEPPGDASRSPSRVGKRARRASRVALMAPASPGEGAAEGGDRRAAIASPEGARDGCVTGPPKVAPVRTPPQQGGGGAEAPQLPGPHALEASSPSLHSVGGSPHTSSPSSGAHCGGEDPAAPSYSASEFQSARCMCRGQRDLLRKFSVEDAAGIWASLKARAARESPRADYLEAHIACAQREGRSDPMEHFMRAILMGWLGELAAAMKLQRETLFLAVNIVDRFLSREPRFSRRQLQLLGCSAMLLAAKMEEVYVPPVDQFAAYTAEDGSCPEDIKSCEMQILRALEYGLHCPTPATFLGVAVSALFKEQTPASCLAYLLAELAGLEYRFLAFPAAKLAAACIGAARVLTGGLRGFGAAGAWSADLEALTGYSRSELALCVDHLLCFHARAKAHVAALDRLGVQLDAPDPLHHVFSKYRSNRAHFAGHVKAHRGGLVPPVGQPLGVGRVRAYADENLGCPGHRMAAYWTTRMGAAGHP